MQLAQITPAIAKFGPSHAAAILDGINKALEESRISTPRARAAFLAQVAHESSEFRYMEELASGEAYEGRRDLGNIELGDGRRFKGRGPIQLTGRANYRRAGEALGLPLEEQPELASTPAIGFRVAGWFWRSRGLTEIAESGDFQKVTRRINGGLNGYADRMKYYERACRALGASTRP